jgi:hypothetical protein
MKLIAVLSAVAFATSRAAFAAGLPQSPEATDNKPIVSIMTPENWTRTTVANGMDRYQPLEVANQGRPGGVICNVLTLADGETRSLSQETIDGSLAKVAPRIAGGEAVGGAVGSVHMTTVSENPVKVSGHNAYLIITKGRLEQGPIVVETRNVTVFFAVPGWNYLSTCTAGGKTEGEADAAWDAWKPTLLAIVQSLNVHY